MIQAEDLKVSKEEYIKFLQNYPKKLVRDVCRIPEPAVETYNDFTDGKSREEAIIAYAYLYNNDEYFNYLPTEYFITNKESN